MKWHVCDLTEDGMLFTTIGFSAHVSGQTHKTYYSLIYDAYTVKNFKRYYPTKYREVECSFSEMKKYIKKYQKLDKQWRDYIKYEEGYTKVKVEQPELYLTIEDLFKV